MLCYCKYNIRTKKKELKKLKEINDRKKKKKIKKDTKELKESVYFHIGIYYNLLFIFSYQIIKYQILFIFSYQMVSLYPFGSKVPLS